ncbi:MAG: Fic family protein [Armatimonadota bacterium]|nr:Fic family protein [Armatimonadota bacterium]
MMSFRAGKLSEPVPMSIVNLVAEVNEFKGRQQLYAEQSPQVLKALQQVAMVQSTESSNRIEGIEVSERKLKLIMQDKVAPQDRPEGEVAGYRDVLSLIHASNSHIGITPNTILQLHRDLFKYIPSEGGRWKHVDNTIDDVLPNGSHIVRFRTVPAVATPQAMDELCASYKQYSDSETTPHLLLAATFGFDFLCIHPFRDGNGRMARLLTLLLLYQGGYEVGRYISLERVIENSRESYYESLAKSSEGWREGEHTLLPWWEYFLGVLIAACRDFETRVGMVENTWGAKSELVRRMAERQVGDFSLTELMRSCPSVSRDTVRSVLEQMRTEGAVECLGRGRSARWRRI